MADFIPYVTKEGERWDTIAYAAYGSLKLTITNADGEVTEVDAIDYIIQANPDIYVEPEMTSGIVLKIPIVEFVQTKSELVPPWKQ